MHIIDKANLSLKDIASKEASRYALNGIYVENGQTVATNGAMLAIVKNPTQGANVKPCQPFIMPFVDVVKLTKSLPKGDHLIEVSSKENEFTCKVGGMAITGKPLAGSYPDYKNIIPDGTKKPKMSITINAEYLFKLAKVAKASGDSGTYNITLDIYGEKEIIGLRARSNDRFSGILCPIIQT